MKTIKLLCATVALLAALACVAANLYPVVGTQQNQPASGTLEWQGNLLVDGTIANVVTNIVVPAGFTVNISGGVATIVANPAVTNNGTATLTSLTLTNAATLDLFSLTGTNTTINLIGTNAAGNYETNTFMLGNNVSGNLLRMLTNGVQVFNLDRSGNQTNVGSLTVNSNVTVGGGVNLTNSGTASIYRNLKAVFDFASGGVNYSDTAGTLGAQLITAGNWIFYRTLNLNGNQLLGGVMSISNTNYITTNAAPFKFVSTTVVDGTKWTNIFNARAELSVDWASILDPDGIALLRFTNHVTTETHIFGMAITTSGLTDTTTNNIVSTVRMGPGEYCTFTSVRSGSGNVTINGAGVNLQ